MLSDSEIKRKRSYIKAHLDYLSSYFASRRKTGLRMLFVMDEPIQRKLQVELGVIPLLDRFVSNKDREMRVYAAGVLAGIAKNTGSGDDQIGMVQTVSIIPLLVRLRNDTDAKVGATALVGIKDIIRPSWGKFAEIEAGVIIPLLVGFLNDEDTDVVTSALKALEDIVILEDRQSAAIEAGAIPILMRFMNDNDVKTVKIAINTLSKMTYENTVAQKLMAEAGAIPILVKWLRDKHVGHDAAWILGRVLWNPDNQASVAGVMLDLSWLRHAREGDIRIRLIKVLRGASTDRERSLAAEASVRPLLEQLLDDPDAKVWIDAANILWQIAENTDNKTLVTVTEVDIIPRLVRAMRDPDLKVKKMALELFKNVVWRARELSGGFRQAIAGGAMPALVELLHDVDKDVRKESLKVISDIASWDDCQILIEIARVVPIPALVELLRDHCSDIRCSAVSILRNVVMDSPCNMEAFTRAQGVPALRDFLAVRGGLDFLYRDDAQELLAQCTGIKSDEDGGLLRAASASDPMASDNIAWLDEEDDLESLEVVTKKGPASSRAMSGLFDDTERLFGDDLDDGLDGLGNKSLHARLDNQDRHLDKPQPSVSLFAFERMQTELAALRVQQASDLDFLETRKLKAMVEAGNTQEMLELERQAILKNTQQRAYYQAMRMHISELVVAAVSIESGYLDVNHSAGAKAVRWICDAMSSAFPGFSTVTSLVKEGVSHLDATYRKHFLKTIRVLGPTVSDADVLGQEVARLLVRAYCHAERPLSAKAAEQDACRLVTGVIQTEADAFTAIELFHFVWKDAPYCIEPISTPKGRYQRIPSSLALAETPRTELLMEFPSQPEQIALKALQDKFSELQASVALKSDVVTRRDLNRIDTELAKLQSKNGQAHPPTHGQGGLILASREAEASVSIQSLQEQILRLEQYVARQDAQICLLSEELQVQREFGYEVSAKAILHSGHFAQARGTRAASAIEAPQKKHGFSSS